MEVCSGCDNLSLLWPVLGEGNMIQRVMRFPMDVAGQDSLAGDSKQEVEILRDDVEKVTRSSSLLTKTEGVALSTESSCGRGTCGVLRYPDFCEGFTPLPVRQGRHQPNTAAERLKGPSLDKGEQGAGRKARLITIHYKALS